MISGPVNAAAWSGRRGRVHEAVLEIFDSVQNFDVYACGAPVMVDAAQRDFIARCGLPPQEFYADSFVTEADKAQAAG